MTVETQLCEVILAHDDAVARLPRHQRMTQARARAVEMMARWSASLLPKAACASIRTSFPAACANAS